MADAALGNLLGRSLEQLRNRDGFLSVIDAAMGITGLNSNSAAETVRTVLRAHPELSDKVVSRQFPGRRQRPTPTADAETLLRIAMLLPGRHAARARADLPRDDAAPRSADALYVMQYVFGGVVDDTAVKIGRSRDPEARRHQLESGQNFWVKLAAVHPGCGVYEHVVHARLAARRCVHGPGVEWFGVSASEADAEIKRVIEEQGPDRRVLRALRERRRSPPYGRPGHRPTRLRTKRLTWL